MADPVWKETFQFLPPGKKRYRKVRLEADRHSVRIKIGRETITLGQCGDACFLQHLQRAIDAQRTLKHIVSPDSWTGVPAPEDHSRPSR